MSENSFTVLGSSSGLPQAARACSGYVLQVGDSLSLIDCGGGVTSSFLRCHFDPMKLDRIFISHTHSDHCCELTLVVQMLHVLGSTRPLHIYIPDEFVRPFMAYLNAVYMFPGHIKPDLHIHGYADKFVYNDQFKLTAVANTHLEKASAIIEEYDVPNKMQCHCFHIEVGGKKLFYSSDIGQLDDISGELEQLDYAVIEATHVDMDRLFYVAKLSSVGQYVLTHLGTEEEVSLLHEKVYAADLDNLIFATDGLRLDL